MTLRQHIENNPTIWLLGSLFAGFVAGFGAYQTILEVSNQTIVSESEYNKMKEDTSRIPELEKKYQETSQKASRVPELEKKIASLKTIEGNPASGHHLTLASNVQDGRPKGPLSEAQLDEPFSVFSKWMGLSGKKYYKEKWQILGPNGLVAEKWHPFVPKVDGEYRSWAHFKLSSDEFSPGKYRLKVFLNNILYENRELIVAESNRATVANATKDE